MKAKDIKGCVNCPLYKSDCKGWWTSDGKGNPIEPPCINWDDENEIYKDMYNRYWEY